MFGFNKRGILNITNITFGFRGKESSTSPPINTVAPKLTGDTTPLSILNCSTGTWTGTPVITFQYQWYLNGIPIIGETTNQYQIKPSDLNGNIYCVVTATNAYGMANASSDTITVEYASLQFDSIFNSQYYSTYFA